MIKIVISGYGRLGQSLEESIKNSSDFELAGIVGNNNGDLYDELKSLPQHFDVIIDFSHVSNTPSILKYVTETHKAVVIATTGHDQKQIEHIVNSSSYAPILFTYNTSLGVNVMIELIKQAQLLFDNEAEIEIIEKHHSHKEDSPSGTAKMLLNALNQEEKYHPHYRQDEKVRRTKNEIGVSSVRIGQIFGEHSVLFALGDELIEIKHTAFSLKLFINGALKAAKFIYDKENKLYSMRDVLLNR